MTNWSLRDTVFLSVPCILGFVSSLIYYEACSNETLSGIAPCEGAEDIKTGSMGTMEGITLV